MRCEFVELDFVLQGHGFLSLGKFGLLQITLSCLCSTLVEWEENQLR